MTAREVKLPVDLEHVHLGVEALVVAGGVELLALGHAGLDGGAEEVGDGDARDLARVLEGEEQPGAGALVGLHGEDGLAVEQHVTLRDRVVPGGPAMALARVLLPVPLGPMMACTSPGLIVRLKPLTMDFSPMLMWRSLISSWLMTES